MGIESNMTMGQIFAIGEIVAQQCVPEDKNDLLAQIRQGLHAAEQIELSMARKSLKPYKVMPCVPYCVNIV